MNGPRDYFFDNAKYLLMMLVVLGHGLEIVSGKYSNEIYRFIYLFHMPCFVAIAGYFAKFHKREKVWNLLLQYVIFQTLYCLFSIFILDQNTKVQYSRPYWILWFLLSLFCWKVILPYVSRLKYPLLFAIVAALIVGYDSSIGYTLGLSRTIVFFPFFLAGYYLKKEHFNKIKELSFVIPLAIILVSVMALYFKSDFHRGLLYNSRSYSAMGLNPYFAWLYRLAFLFWGALLGLSFFYFVPKGKVFFSAFGARTLQVFLLHGFMMRYLGHIKISKILNTPSLKMLFYFGILVAANILALRIVEILTTWLMKPIKTINLIKDSLRCRHNQR